MTELVYCEGCGQQLPAAARFCRSCGRSQPEADEPAQAQTTPTPEEPLSAPSVSPVDTQAAEPTAASPAVQPSTQGAPPLAPPTSGPAGGVGGFDWSRVGNLASGTVWGVARIGTLALWGLAMVGAFSTGAIGIGLLAMAYCAYLVFGGRWLIY